MGLKQRLGKMLGYASPTQPTQVDKISSFFFQRRFWIGLIVLITIYLLITGVFDYIGSADLILIPLVVTDLVSCYNK